MKATISEKGQVTIPKPIRHRMGLSAGIVVDFKEQQGKIVVTKLSPSDPIEGLVGVIKSMDVDQYLDNIRGKVN